MLGADQRMRRSAEFASAIRAGRRARRGLLVVHLQLGQQLRGRVIGSDVPEPERRSDVRAGLVVPRAVGSAVVRNKLRRRLRHLLRVRLSELPVGSRLVVRALAGAGQCSFAELGADLDQAVAVAGRRAREVSR